MIINSLTILSSLGCNLNCDYCKLSASRNKESIQLQENTIKALQNGTYLNNIQQVLLKLNQSPAGIEYISLWGQEPTLTLQHITDNIDKWFQVFLNWKTFMFSTNGIANHEKIINLIKAIDNTINYEFQFKLQVSYDGDYGTEKYRKANSDLIHQNISNIILSLNTMKLKNVKVKIFFHGVLSLKLLNDLKSFEDIYNYHQNIHNWTYSLGDLNLNENVKIDNEIGLGIENPVDATTQDGINLSNFIKASLKVNKENFPRKENTSNLGEILIRQGKINLEGFYESILQKYNTTLDNLHQLMNENPKIQNEIVSELSVKSWCGFCQNELKIFYDGTLMPCQNHLFDLNEEYIEKKDFDDYVRYSLATHNYFVNPLKDDKQKINQLVNLFSISKNSSFAMYYQTTVNTMIWLLRAKQIDESYNDIRKLLKHAFVVVISNACYYNSQVKTGSIFVKNAGFIRLLCNGYLDYII